MKTVLCFLYDTFVDFEVSLACHYIDQEEDFQVAYIAYETSAVKSLGGLTVVPDKSVSEISSTKDIEGIIFPGGVERDLKPVLKELVNKLNNENKLVAAICAGPEFLAKAGILKGKKFTTTVEPSEYSEKNESDPFPRESYVEARMVRDGNIITAKGSAFGRNQANPQRQSIDSGSHAGKLSDRRQSAV